MMSPEGPACPCHRLCGPAPVVASLPTGPRKSTWLPICICILVGPLVLPQHLDFPLMWGTELQRKHWFCVTITGTLWDYGYTPQPL